MGFMDKLRGELIDIIEWTDDSRDTMVFRFQRHNNEIKYGARLVVREGQTAVFVDKGQLADVFAPGMYRLETGNLPILSTLLGWKHGFQSPFKAEVYFVSSRRFTDLKWGTKNPLMLRDADFGVVRLRAFGTYAIRVHEPGALIRQIVGTDGHFTTDEITDQLRNIIVSRFADILGESKISALDLVANYDEMGELLTRTIQPEFQSYGLEATKLLVENISLPPEVEKAMDKRTSMGVIGNMDTYAQYQTASAIEDAAQNAGSAGGMMGMGMGVMMAGQMGQAMSPQPNQVPAQTPPPIPVAVQFYVAAGGQQTGPFGLDILSRQVAQGQLTRETLVWQAGMAQWAPAGQVAELSPLFPEMPPPLPPQGV